MSCSKVMPVVMGINRFFVNYHATLRTVEMVPGYINYDLNIVDIVQTSMRFITVFNMAHNYHICLFLAK